MQIFKQSNMKDWGGGCLVVEEGIGGIAAVCNIGKADLSQREQTWAAANGRGSLVGGGYKEVGFDSAERDFVSMKAIPHCNKLPWK